MTLHDLANPPAAAELLLPKTLLSPLFPVTAGELTVSIESKPKVPR